MRSKIQVPFVKRLAAFAVEDTSAQIVWGDSSPGELSIAFGDRSILVENRSGGPGAVDIEGLAPKTAYRLSAHVSGRGGSGQDVLARARFHTLPPPPGAELTRFATMSDLHIGKRSFGLMKTIVEVPQPAEPHPMRCARAAIYEAERWGAKAMFVKGDITDRGSVEHWHQANEVLGKASVPLFALPGNHDTTRVREVEPDIGFDVPRAVLVDDVFVKDLPGVRLILANTALAQLSRGAIAHRTDGILSAVAESSGPVLILTHQQLHARPVPYYHPLGIAFEEATELLDGLKALGRPTMLSSGHTHRNRVRRRGAITISEVGSTKDYPGVWAGYVVHEGGIRQVVRRVAEPSAMQWTEYTRRAVGGIWALWSPGRTKDRNFTVTW